MTATAASPAALLRLLSRSGCHLCDEMRCQVDEILGDSPHEWEIVDVDSDPALAAEFGEAIPVLYVNGRLFAKSRLPPIAAALRLRRAAGIRR
jgi:Glutaredoxin-like domain (DUF836)